MFAGRFDHALDEKGRTMMPKRFRKRLDATDDRSIWMAMALDGTRHLEVRPNTSFQDYFKRVSALKQTKQVQDFKRFYFGAALEVDLDSNGRILIPQALRQRLNLSDKIAFVGVDEHFFEIWNPDALEERFLELQELGDDLSSHLADLGL